jgi:carbon monoxide dehydrogenase subunit G
VGTITATRLIDAPIGEVFHAVADIDNFANALPHIVRVEFLTPQKTGVGTRFVETRLLKRKETRTTLEVVEYVEAEMVRLVSDQGGTIWDTTFRVAEVGFQTELVMQMEARAYALLAKVVNPLIRGMVAKAVEADMDAVKAYCER